MLLAAFVAVAGPIAFLGLVQRLDLYASGSFQTVLRAFFWGLVAFGLAYVINTPIAIRLPVAFVLLVIVPIVEEIVKSLALLVFVRRPDFTYFVDGAIYGFAIGIAFAVAENLFYLSNSGGAVSMTLVVLRTFSTSLMHGSTSALVGISLGRMRFGRGRTRVLALLLGWASAILLHMLFNWLVSQPLGDIVIPLAIGVGLSGLALTAQFIAWGLAEERTWLRDTLSLGIGVSAGESAIIQQLKTLDLLLAPIRAHFGPEKHQQVERFLRLQARIGLKQKAFDMTTDGRLQIELAEQIAALRQEMDHLRQAVGVYCMAYVRSILPLDAPSLWERLDQGVGKEQVAAAVATAPTNNLWATLGQRVIERKDANETATAPESAETPRVNIYNPSHFQLPPTTKSDSA